MTGIQISAVAKLFDPISPSLRPYVRHAGNLLWDKVREQPNGEWVADIYVFADGRIRFMDPYLDGSGKDNASVCVWLFADHVTLETVKTPVRSRDLVFTFHVQLHCLLALPAKFSAYCVKFDTESEDASFNQVKRGYIGITGRSPVTRYKEHLKKAATGTGSVLHRAWAALKISGIDYLPVFEVYRMDMKSLQEAYDVEERSVDNTKTLAPDGLNAIPGGMAGIRMMHELRLLNGSSPISLEKRDAAIEKLLTHGATSKATHYRSGHVRKLDGGQRTTWVRSCWVNMPEAIAA